MLEKMKDLIRRHGTCVLATVGPEQRPHCSLMSYLPSEDCRRLYLLTGKATRKYRNMKANPNVSLLLDTRADAAASGLGAVYALAMEARLTALPEGAEKAELTRRILARHPHLAELAAELDSELVAVAIERLQLLEGPLKSHYASMD